MRRPRDRAKNAADAREVAQLARHLAENLSAADGEPLITYAEGHQPYGSLNSNPPVSCLGLTEDNLLRLDI